MAELTSQERLQPSLLDRLTDDDNCILEGQPFEKCAKEKQMFVYEHSAFWQCMDTLKDKEALDAMWNAENCPWRIGR